MKWTVDSTSSRISSSDSVVDKDACDMSESSDFSSSPLLHGLLSLDNWNDKKENVIKPFLHGLLGLGNWNDECQMHYGQPVYSIDNEWQWTWDSIYHVAFDKLSSETDSLEVEVIGVKVFACMERACPKTYVCQI